MNKKSHEKPDKTKVSGKTNKTKKSLVKAIILEDKGKWLKPEKGSSHYIDEDANLPEVIFEIETASPGPYEWKWHIKWDAKVSGLRESENRGKSLKVFEEKGSIKSDKTTWKMDYSGKVLGGFLTVEVNAGDEVFKRSIYVKAKNPSTTKITEFISKLDGANGFDKILQHEAHGKNFINADGQPIVSFDKGYGITQMTNPAPSYEQCWNWKENIKAGKSIYVTKKDIAKNYLSKKGKDSFTSEQLLTETYSRYNGGSYYDWDPTQKKWTPSKFVCDTDAANIGWQPIEELNKDKTADELHKRDKDTFKLGKKGQSKDHPWKYTGVCYAEHVKKL